MEERIKSLIAKSKKKYQYLAFEDDHVYIGIRETRSSCIKLYKSLQSLGLTPVNCVYGRWVFKINNYTGGID